MTDYKALRKAAEAQARAYERLLELDGGIGLLAMKEREMADDMMVWRDLSENDHADVVLALLDKAEAFDRLTSDDTVEKVARAIARRAGAEFDWPNFESSARAALTAALEGSEK